MPNNNDLRLSILSSYCWIDHSSDAISVLKDKFADKADFGSITLKQIPPIKRRRLNGLAKMAMHSSLSCLERANIDPSEVITVFASQHGELNRTISIINTMSEQQEVSPKDFSLSVHNSSLGLFSIFNKNRYPGTSIAASSNTFGYGLLESFNYLQRFPDKKVLLTCFDLEVEEPFSQLQESLFPSHSVSLLLSSESGEQPNLSFSFNRLDSKGTISLPLELGFINYWHSDTQHTVINSENTTWKFGKNVL